MVTVQRGAYGTCVSIQIRDLVVGDVVDLQQGDRVPADCLLFEEMNMVVDQSMYDARHGQVTKEESLEYDANFHEPDNHKEHPDPFMLADSKVLSGQGKALVLAVGASTYAARNRSKSQLVLSEQQTQLERKLEGIAEQVGKYAAAAMAISVVTHLIHFIIVRLFTDKAFFSSGALLEVAKIVIIAVVLLIVAIPEGLPLAVSIAMAMSIESLKKDEILIKNIESI